MANVTDHATNAAAVAAGYTRIQIDRGAPGVQDKNPQPRYASRYEKNQTGEPGQSGRLMIAQGESNVDQATADTQALAVLNANRRHFYGGSPGRASGQPQ